MLLPGQRSRSVLGMTWCLFQIGSSTALTQFSKDQTPPLLFAFQQLLTSICLKCYEENIWRAHNSHRINSNGSTEDPNLKKPKAVSTRTCDINVIPSNRKHTHACWSLSVKALGDALLSSSEKTRNSHFLLKEKACSG